MTPCKFTFGDSPAFDGFSDGSTWNGFDNVAVTLEAMEKIAAYFEAQGDIDTAADLREMPRHDEPMHPVTSEPLIDLGWGYTTTIVRDETKTLTTTPRVWNAIVHLLENHVEYVEACEPADLDMDSENDQKAFVQEMIAALATIAN